MAATLGLAGIALIGVTNPAQADHTVTPVGNDNLGSSCAIDIVIILDESGSISSSEGNDVVTAYTSFLNGLLDTDSRAGVVVFDTFVNNTTGGYVDITTGSISGALSAGTLGYSPPGDWTNWQDALETAGNGSVFPNPDLVMILTDGDPTAFNNDPDGFPGGETPPGPEIDNAVTAANAIKNGGAHMFAVGVSSAPTVHNLVAISGPDTGTPTPGNIQGLDYITTSFDDLELAMGGLAAILCDPAVELTKNANPSSSPETDGLFTFTLTIANNSPDGESFDITSLDDTYEGVGGVDFSACDDPVTDPGTGLVGTSVAVSSQVTCTYTVTLTALGDHSNTASVAVVDEDGRTEDDTDDETVTVLPAADLELSKTVNAATPDVGTNVTFTITVTNNGGPSAASGVEVKDVLPSGYTYVSDSGSGAYNSGTGIWSVGALAVDASDSLEIVASVDATGSYENYAQVWASNEHDPDSTPGDDSTNQDDDDTASTTPVPVADLSLSKTVSNATPDVGSNVTFTVGVTNDGPSQATGVTVDDDLPTGYAYVSDDGGGAYVSGTGIWTVGSLANGASVTL
jgi:uncharacterized repeat protein (TIGR01451 family)